MILRVQEPGTADAIAPGALRLHGGLLSLYYYLNLFNVLVHLGDFYFSNS